METDGGGGGGWGWGGGWGGTEKENVKVQPLAAKGKKSCYEGVLRVSALTSEEYGDYEEKKKKPLSESRPAGGGWGH